LVFSPTKINVPSEDMNCSFTNFDVFRKDINAPSVSKADY